MKNKKPQGTLEHLDLLTRAPLLGALGAAASMTPDGRGEREHLSFGSIRGSVTPCCSVVVA